MSRKTAIEIHIDTSKIEKNIARNIENSFNRMNPLYDLTKRDQERFILSLDKDGKEELIKALEFYYRLAIGEQFKK